MRRTRCSQFQPLRRRAGVIASVMQRKTRVQVPVDRVTNSTGLAPSPPNAPIVPAITIPNNASTITIGRDGTISVELNTGGQQVLGQLQVARFLNPAGLMAVGQNLLKETPASGAPQVQAPGTNGAGTLMQGTLEASNVNVVEEMVNMIETQRAYEINSKAISAVDGMLKYINQNM